MLKSKKTVLFDFSLDVPEFKAKLARQLKEIEAAQAVPLDDEDLAELNAAGDPYRIPQEKKLPG